MAHFIQPITISSVAYCVKHGATTPKWRTVSLLGANTALTGSEDGDSWTNTLVNDLSGFTFGVSCAITATVRFTFTPNATGNAHIGEVQVDGVVVDIFSITGTDGVQETIDLDLTTTGSPCGELVDIVFTGNFQASGYTIEILSVTFV